MQSNPQEGKIILVERSEMDADAHGSFLRVITPDGSNYRIGEKRSELWDIFQNARKNEPVLAVFETFTKGKDKITFIADAKPITDDILKGAVQKQGIDLFNATDQQKNRSVAVSYAIAFLKDRQSLYKSDTGIMEDDELIDRAEHIGDELGKFIGSGIKRSDVTDDEKTTE